MRPWSNLARVVTKRTYARKDSGTLENWSQTVDRAIGGNIRGHNVPEHEVAELRRLMIERKAGPAGRGYWFSGAPAHERLGGVALCNCWYLNANDWYNFVVAQDLLMTGGGVGLSVEHRFVSKLPKVKRGVVITHKLTKDAGFIVPDSREGWDELTYRVLESFFVTGKSFSYSTVCVRGYGEDIKGFGGTASGPMPLINFITNLCGILIAREGKHVRPIDASDILCATGEMVVAGNVRRSAIIILGDPWDRDYLKAKRWDLAPLPSYRSCANFSVVTDDIEDVHGLFWKTYEHGEAFGIFNRTATQKFGRMGELKKDTAEGINPCGESTLEPGEPCNLQEIALGNLASEAEFHLAARLMHRWGKRVTMEKYHHPQSQEVVSRNRRVGTGITGCLESALFTPAVLDRVYAAIQKENADYSRELGIPESIRSTLVKPSGTMSKCMDQKAEGIHAAFSRYSIQRVRFASSDPLVAQLRDAGHHIEPVLKLDGTLDHATSVVDFYLEAPAGVPVADEDWDTWKQLDVLKTAAKHWSDQSVSVTVYYDRKDIPKLKTWLGENLSELKSISFLCHSDHGFKQAPKEAITREQYERLSSKVREIDVDEITPGGLESMECAGGVCPVR